LHESIDKAGVPLQEVSTGDTLDGGHDCHIEILHPPSRGVIGTENANSIVLDVEYCGRRILMTGDLASPGLDDVIAEVPMPCDLLVVPHHGSKTSNPIGLSAWCTPHYAVFSADHRYDTRSVEAIYAQRGRTLHTTDVGAVTMTIGADGEERVETFRQPGVSVEPIVVEEPAPDDG
jgi:competence protein ComEC